MCGEGALTKMIIQMFLLDFVQYTSIHRRIVTAVSLFLSPPFLSYRERERESKSDRYELI